MNQGYHKFVQMYVVSGHLYVLLLNDSTNTLQSQTSNSQKDC